MFASDVFQPLRPQLDDFTRDPEAASLLLAAFEGKFNTVEMMEHMIDRPMESLKDDLGRTALHYAAAGGKYDVLVYLVEIMGFPADIRDSLGETPLHQAIVARHHGCAEYLLDYDADPNAATYDDGCTPFHYAAGAGSKKLVTLLLSRGAKVDVKSSYGTALHFAFRNKVMVKTLLEHNANPNIVISEAMSPLVMAIVGKRLETVKLLLKAGADPNLTPRYNLFGISPLGTAVMEGAMETIKLLLNAGADPNASDNVLAMKPAELAGWLGMRQAAKLLLPLTSPNPKVPTWTFNGIKKYYNAEPQAAEIHSQTEERRLLFKSKGKDAFIRKQHALALLWYTQAKNLNPLDETVLSNLSACWVRMKNGGQALSEARACIMLKPEWPKAYYREGMALNLLKEFRDAAKSFAMGLQFDPGNKELEDALRQALADAADPRKTFGGLGFF
ncbi:unnamed protein product [Linum trigynum]|uniref:Uncharacterized protein n=1 Tax=Linum trigynum TaxID=586398 RepID=A0AAV2EB58_9ROSI